MDPVVVMKPNDAVWPTDTALSKNDNKERFPCSVDAPRR